MIFLNSYYSLRIIIMARKKKGSFFERLTGTINIDQDSEEKSVPVEKGSEKEDDDLLDEDVQDAQLAVEVYQTPTDIVIKTIVAGVRPDDLDVSITRDMVTIRGKREGTRSVEDDDYYYQELYWGSFSRSITLPQEVEVEDAEAVEKHGLLIITLPKIDRNKKTKLKIKSH